MLIQAFQMHQLQLVNMNIGIHLMKVQQLHQEEFM